MDGEPLDDTGSTDAFSGGRTLPSTAQEPCPVCGRLFSKRYIATHADKCAAQTQKGQRAKKPTPEPKPTPRWKPSRKRTSPADVAPTRRSMRRPSSTRGRPGTGVSASIWDSEDGGETVQIRNLPAIECKELPVALIASVDALDAHVEELPIDAVSITTARGGIDQKKTLELRRSLKEEEEQLALYNQTGRGGGTKAKKRRRVAPKRRLVMRVRATEDGYEAMEISRRRPRDDRAALSELVQSSRKPRAFWGPDDAFTKLSAPEVAEKLAAVLNPSNLASLVDLLKDHNRRKIPADTVSRRIAALLKDHPVLLAEFDFFLAFGAPDTLQGPWHSDDLVPWTQRNLGAVKTRSPPLGDKSPVWKADLTDDDPDDGGYSDFIDDERYDDDGDLDMVDDPDLTRRAIAARAPPEDTEPTSHHLAVDATVHNAVGALVALSETRGPQYSRDYDIMKALTYKVWRHFKDDPYTFDAFGNVILRACQLGHTGPTGDPLLSMFDSLDLLFQDDADGLIDELRQSLAPPPQDDIPSSSPWDYFSPPPPGTTTHPSPSSMVDPAAATVVNDVTTPPPPSSSPPPPPTTMEVC